MLCGNFRSIRWPCHSCLIRCNFLSYQYHESSPRIYKMFKYCLIDTRQCLSNQWIILTGLTYIISSIPDVIFFSSYRGSIADFIILSFSNQYYFLLIILPLLFLFLLKIDWLPSSTILLRNASITTYVIARFSALVISLPAPL